MSEPDPHQPETKEVPEWLALLRSLKGWAQAAKAKATPGGGKDD